MEVFAKIAGKITAKKGIYLALIIYTGITFYAYFLDSALDFWILAGIVGMIQGGAQVLSLSLYGIMVPESKSAEFFCFLEYPVNLQQLLDLLFLHIPVN
jgi:UMF1 family MFS transporter